MGLAQLTNPITSENQTLTNKFILTKKVQNFYKILVAVF